MRPDTRWRLTDPDLLCRAWPGEAEVVAFSPRAGSLHLLTASAHALMQELSRRPLTTAEIITCIAREITVARDVVEEALPDLVQVLRDAELIQPVGP